MSWMSESTASGFVTGEPITRDTTAATCAVLQFLIGSHATTPERAIRIDAIAAGAGISERDAVHTVQSLATAGLAVLPVLDDSIAESQRAFYVTQAADDVDEAARRMRGRACQLEARAQFLDLVADAMRRGVQIWEAQNFPVA